MWFLGVAAVDSVSSAFLAADVGFEVGIGRVWDWRGLFVERRAVSAKGVGQISSWAYKVLMVP
jgi:hypothetical protein